MRDLDFSRRSFVAASLAVAAAPAARAQTAETLRVGTIPATDVAPLYAAIKQGYFRDEGLAIDTSANPGGATGVTGLVGGSYDITYGNVVSTLLAAQQGLDVKVIAPGVKLLDAADDPTALIVRSDGAIKSGKDLEGKSVGVNARNGIIWLYARAWIRKTGGNPDLVTFREIPFPSMEDALRQSRVDAIYSVPPFAKITLGQPQFAAIAQPYTDVQPGLDIGHYLVTGTFLATRGASVEKFARALRRGIDWYNADRENSALLAVIADYTGLKTDVLRTIHLPLAPKSCDPAQMAATMRLLLAEGLLKQPVDIGKLVAPIALAM